VDGKQLTAVSSRAAFTQNDFVTLRLDLYEEQMRQKAADRRHRKMIDPARMGLWDE